MYRTVPTAQGLRTEVFWADRFRGIRNQSGTTLDRLARHDHESLAQSSAVAQAMVRGFEDAYTRDIAKYNDIGRKHNNVLSIVTLPDGKQSRKAMREAEKRLAAVNEAIDNSPLLPFSKTALRMELRAHHMVGEFADYVEKAKRKGAEERREFRAENGRSPDPTDFGEAEYRWPDVEYDVFPAGWVGKHNLNDAEVERIEEVIYWVFERAMLYGRPKKAARSR